MQALSKSKTKPKPKPKPKPKTKLKPNQQESALPLVAACFALKEGKQATLK